MSDWKAELSPIDFAHERVKNRDFKKIKYNFGTSSGPRSMPEVDPSAELFIRVRDRMTREAESHRYDEKAGQWRAALFS